MGFTPTGFTTATAITTAEMEAEMTLVRDWVNTGIVVGDVAAAALDKTHIYRPEVYGFPKQSIEGQLQDAYDRNVGVSGNPHVYAHQSGEDLTGPSTILPSRSRFSIFPQRVDGSARIAQMMARIYVDQGSDVEITAQFFATVRINSTSSTSLHPQHAGDFRLFRVETSTGTKTNINSSRRRLTATIIDTARTKAIGNSQFSLYSVVEDIGAGTHDIGVEYVKDSAKSDVAQVIIANASIVIEVHKQ